MVKILMFQDYPFEPLSKIFFRDYTSWSPLYSQTFLIRFSYFLSHDQLLGSSRTYRHILRISQGSGRIQVSFRRPLVVLRIPNNNLSILGTAFIGVFQMLFLRIMGPGSPRRAWWHSHLTLGQPVLFDGANSDMEPHTYAWCTESGEECLRDSSSSRGHPNICQQMLVSIERGLHQQ